MLKWFGIIILLLFQAEKTSAQKLPLGTADSTENIVSDTTPQKETAIIDTIVIEEVAAKPEIIAEEKKVDKTETVARHSPAKAALLSAALPGLGQAYNKKYWKIPIVYTGFAGLGYWMGTNVKNYRIYDKAYRLRMDGDSTTIDKFADQYSSDDLRTLKRFYRRNLDLSVILTVVWYALNIVDATVDAHLFEFDVSDNLSLRVEPVLEYHSRANNYTGLKVGLRF